jgi:uncharacterized protein (DUF1501 family)
MNTPLSRRRFIGQANCAAISSLPILNTLLNLRLLEGVASASVPASGEYRALVCLFLAGGNDSYNMLVPRETTAYNTYTNTRADLALTPAELLEINPIGLPGFYVHGAMPAVRSLFEAGKAAFVANVGTLIEPVENRTQVEQSLKRLPLGLYSHSDQLEQWQTSIPHGRSGIGWGGRMADLLKDLNGNPVVPMQVSLDGSNTWQTGNTTAEYAITPTGAVGLTGYSPGWVQYAEAGNAMSSAVDSQLALQYSNLLQQTFATRKRQSLDAYQAFAAASAPPLPNGVTFPSTYIGQRLAMVARAIQGRNALGAVRQTFFIQRGGWDHHDEVVTNQLAMLGEVSAAIGAFQNAMAALGVENNVALFTASDFGRTLTSNGRGSDHAWGGNHLVVGGGMAGRRIYGQYPSLAVNPDSGPEVNPIDTGRGRFIPTTSCDVLFAELALWLGVSKSQLSLILPNIGNFYSTSSSSPPLGMLV